MASSKKRPKSKKASSQEANILSQLKRFLQDLFRQQKRIQPTLLVAYSGGLDSTVLLHALHQLQTDLPMQLQVMHINHGLSPHADDWQAFCASACANLDLPFDAVKVDIDTEEGLGIEATAREERYQALLSVSTADFVCLGHHQDDQAETFMLQLARGAGVKGLSAMPQVDLQRRLLRPLLNFPRKELLDFAQHHQLEWIDDESNLDTQFARNQMRHEVMPALLKQYPSIQKTLSRAASHMAQAHEMLEALAQTDAESVIEATGCDEVLNLHALHQLSDARQGNVLRYWINRHQLTMPNTALLTQMVVQLQSTRTDASIKVKVAEGLYLRRYSGQAFLVSETKCDQEIDLFWQGEGVIELSDASRLIFKQDKGKGFAFQRMGVNTILHIKNRQGGEHLMTAENRPKRSLKTILQAAKIPPWQREQMPLIFMDNALVIIPDVAVDARFQANADELGLTVSWLTS